MSVRIVVPTTIALPPWIMAASVFFCFCTSGPARLVAAWGCLVRLSQSLGTTSRWYKLTRLVVWVDGVLSPFKLPDWRERALAAEREVAEAIAARDRAFAARDGAVARAAVARRAALQEIFDAGVYLHR